MPTIHLTTFIQAPIERVFDLSRSINLRTKSTTDQKEKAISGVITGLIELNETVTWQARRLGKTRILQLKITAITPFSFFCEEMLKGDFTRMKHEHHFKQVENGTLMIDLFTFETPYSTFGKMLNVLFLTRYLQKMLEKRNLVIKEYAETNKWNHVL